MKFVPVNRWLRIQGSDHFIPKSRYLGMKELMVFSCSLGSSSPEIHFLCQTSNMFPKFDRTFDFVTLIYKLRKSWMMAWRAVMEYSISLEILDKTLDIPRIMRWSFVARISVQLLAHANMKKFLHLFAKCSSHLAASIYLCFGVSSSRSSKHLWNYQR